jgi:DDE superfamily endonuclease
LLRCVIVFVQLRSWSERRNEELVQEFSENIAFLYQDQIVFIDETGKSGRQLERRRGRGPRGCRPRVSFKRRGSGGQRCNVVAAMTSTEVLMPYVHKGTCNAETFLDALRTSVVSCNTISI